MRSTAPRGKQATVRTTCHFHWFKLGVPCRLVLNAEKDHIVDTLGLCNTVIISGQTSQASLPGRVSASVSIKTAEALRDVAQMGVGRGGVSAQSLAKPKSHSRIHCVAHPLRVLDPAGVRMYLSHSCGVVRQGSSYVHCSCSCFRHTRIIW